MLQWKQLNFRKRLLIIMALSGLIELLLLSAVFFVYLKDWEARDTGQKALGVAKLVASMPEVIDAVERKKPELIADKIEEFRRNINANFIVIGDEKGIRLIHPIAERVGLEMRGGDNPQALIHGESYVSFATGSMGQSVRGKTPVFNASGEIIGVVSVGYLLTSIHEKVEHFLFFLIFMAILVVMANILLSGWVAARFQRAILGFEPEEIGQLYVELDVTLSAIREGVLRIDQQGVLKAINRSACAMLGLDYKSVIHRPLSEVLPQSNLDRLLRTGEAEHDMEVFLGDKVIIANRMPLIVEGQVVGVVSSFRLKDEITELNRQLSKVKQYTELLRAQTHEHRNKLNTISGLLQLGAVEQAQRLIGQENLHYEQLIDFLRGHIHEPVIAGLLLGKSERARELGLSLNLDEGSRLESLPKHIPANDLVTILGNLIDNAFDAMSAQVPAPIQVSISDYGHDLILEVEDRGCGIPNHVSQEDILALGFSTKSGQNRGVGLYLVAQLVERYHGQLSVESSSTTGTRMTVYLPKEVMNE